MNSISETGNLKLEIGAWLLVAACGLCRAAVPTLGWDAEATKSLPKTWPLRQGATARLEARILDNGAPLALDAGTPCLLYWQTNGMAGAWWSLPAEVSTNGVASALFTASVPAPSKVSFFFRVGETNAIVYDALGTLNILPSPGAVVNTLPLPASVLDFGEITVLNPPWATLNDVDAAISDALEGYEPGGGGVIEESDPVAATWQTNHLATANPHGITPAGIGAVPGTAGTGGHALGVDIYRGGDIARTTLSAGGVAVKASLGTTTFGDGGIVKSTASGTWTLNSTGASLAGFGVPEPWSFAWADLAQLDDLPDVSIYVTTNDLEQSVAAIEGDVLAAVFSLTNALLVVSNGVASVETNGVPVWSSGAGSVPPSVTNELWQSIAALQGTVASLQGTVAALSHDWGAYAPDGSPNPDPEYMLWINRPATVWGAGFQWAVSGGHAVLTATGAVAFASGGNGEMRIGPGDGTNYFGFVQGGSVEVGASASGITVADDVATIVYPCESGDFPTLWFTPDLATPFEIMTGVAWLDNADGTATASAPATTPKGFWRATTSASYAAEFRSTMPARFSGGVWGATNAVPVIYDSTVTIESGGKSYRIPAEEL